MERGGPISNGLVRLKLAFRRLNVFLWRDMREVMRIFGLYHTPMRLPEIFRIEGSSRFVTGMIASFFALDVIVIGLFLAPTVISDPVKLSVLWFVEWIAR